MYKSRPFIISMLVFFMVLFIRYARYFYLNNAAPWLVTLLVFAGVVCFIAAFLAALFYKNSKLKGQSAVKC